MPQKERGELIVGLDIGTTKICAVVGEVFENHVDIIGVGAYPSVGLRKGMVVNIESTVQSIRKAVEEAEIMADCEISSVYVGIAGSHVKGFNSHGLTPLKHKEITQDDIDQVVYAAKSIAIAQDQEIIHVLPQSFTVDSQDGIQDPTGMTGVRLEADVHIVTGAATAVHNLIKCCNRAGLEVDDIVLEPIASAEAVLSPEEMELGVALLDIGGGTSDLAVFANSCIQQTFVLGIGGHNLTNDLSIGLRTPLHDAERLKEKFGCAISSMINRDQAIEVPSVGGRRSRKLSQRVMGEILEPRVDELLTLINRELVDSGNKEFVTSGVVMTGGTSMLVHMVELAEQIFDLPVRIGYPQHVGGITDIISTPQCATGVGLVLYGMKNGPRSGSADGNSALSRLTKGIKGLFRRMV